MFGSGLPSGLHSDVLGVEPQSDPQRNNLVEELKRRGNAAFKTGSLKEAEVLYGHAIEISKKKYDGKESEAETIKALLSNRSMTLAKMGKFEEAAKDAQETIKLDASFSKGFYRLGVALKGMKKFDDALVKLQEALTLEPGNKQVMLEIEKMDEEKAKWAKEVEIRRNDKAEFDAIQAEQNSKVIKKMIIADENVDSESKKETKKKDSDADMSMRGYRTTKDGRKTTFFNMERSEEELRLIGECKPQKLESDAEIEKRKILEAGGSVWNEGGTFEEKDMNDWAKSKLKELILACFWETNVSIEGKKLRLNFRAKDLEDLEGDASVTFTRGKQRKIFDFNFKVAFTVEVLKDVEIMREVKMSLVIPDFSGDVMASEEDLEIQLVWSGREHAEPYSSAISTAIPNFQKKIEAALKLWYAEFLKL